MELTNSFTVPRSVAEAWDILLDIERVAQCVPGAAIDTVDGDTFTGRVRVKLGPVQLTYRGTAQFVERDDTAHRAVVKATGKETKGSGTASATITTSLKREGDQTRVNVLTALTVTGKPAQFGRGVMQDVSNQLLTQFADCLAHQLSASRTGVTGLPPHTARAAASDSDVTSRGAADSPIVDAQHRQSRSADDAINIIGVAGWPVVKRVALPLLALLAVIVVIIIAI